MMDLTDLFCKSFDTTIYTDLEFGIKSVHSSYSNPTIFAFYVININFFNKSLFETSVYYNKAFTVSNLMLKPYNSFVVNFNSIENISRQKLHSAEVYRIDCILTSKK